jgi:cytoskeletal protein CcmA (bactofilin family)
LVVGEEGRVHGEIRGTRVVVNGRVVGTVVATELLELQPRARISGELRYAAMEIHRGAVIEARLDHAGSAPEAAKAPPRAQREQAPLPAANAA